MASPALALLCTFCVLNLAVAAPLPGERDLTDYTYQQYLSEFGKGYEATEHDSRAQVFASNLAVIKEHNADTSKTWFATVNEFTDWTNQEFRQRRAHGTSSRRGSDLPFGVGVNADIFDKAVPASVDWRTKAGVVTPVKNQGGCGSCWAFSATETIESALAMATGKPAPVLSPQQIVSCAPNPKQCGGSGGCDGSTQELAFNYTETAGLTLESDYKYTGTTGSCQTAKIHPVAKNKGFVKLPANNYTALVSAVANIGPIAISVAAGSMGWQIYGGGVFSSKCGWDQDHAVQLVGYEADSWIVRNSWGAGWGEKGYIRIKKYGEGKEPCGTDTTPADGSACKGDTSPVKLCGLCGILSDSSYPTGMSSVGPAPSPGPSPSPPAPSPPSPGCADTEDSGYCQFVVKDNSCSLLSDKCMKSCKCCDASPPSYCGQAAKRADELLV